MTLPVRNAWNPVRNAWNIDAGLIETSVAKMVAHTLTAATAPIAPHRERR